MIQDFSVFFVLMLHVQNKSYLIKGEGALLEVFDKSGKHLGEADPLTGKLDRSKADPDKTLRM